MDLKKKVRSRDTHLSVVQKIINTVLRKLYREYGDTGGAGVNYIGRGQWIKCPPPWWLGDKKFFSLYIA